MTACERPSDTSAYRLPSEQLSLSHAAGIAVAAVPLLPGTVNGIGVDLELDRDPVPATARFYLTRTERQLAGSDPRSLLRLWTVKEALYKADPANAGTALFEYELDDPAAPHGTARHRSGRRFHYRSVPVHRGVLTIAIHPKSSRRKPLMQTIDYDAVARQISVLTGVPITRLSPGTVLTDLAPDSFTFVEMAVDLQEEFETMLSQEDLKSVVTVSDLVTRLRQGRGDE
nr:4'-phosphopantetheinyl transferase superfamily protein [Kineosporia mesophila]